MKRLKITLSPLTVVFTVGILLFFDGKAFLIYWVSILLHEYAHHLVALRFGLCMDEIRLYPFGAVLYGELHRLDCWQEIAVALAGPLFNLFPSVVFTALWWMVPELYVLTDAVVTANTSLALFNLLPLYPLDGGRILLNLLTLKKNPRAAFRFLRIFSLTASLLCFALYLLSCFTGSPNYTAGMAGFLVLAGVLDGGTEIKLRKSYSSRFSEEKLRRGIEVRTLAVSAELTLFETVKLLHADCYYRILFLDENGTQLATLEHDKLSELVQTQNLHVPVKTVLNAASATAHDTLCPHPRQIHTDSQKSDVNIPHDHNVPTGNTSLIYPQQILTHSQKSDVNI